MKIWNNLKFNRDYFYLINNAISLCKLGSKGDYSKFFKLLILLFTSGISSTLPVLILVPFISIISKPEKIWEIEIIRKISNYWGISNPNQLFLPFLMLFIVVVAINTYLNLFTIKFNNNLKASIGSELGRVVFKKVIYSTYENHITTSSGKIITDFSESIRRCVESISLFLDGLTSFFTFIFLFITLLIVNKQITFLLIFFVSIIYFSVAIIKNKIIKKEGRILTVSRKAQTELIQESLGSKKDILLMSNQDNVIRKFASINEKAEFSEKTIDTALQSPKYLIEGSFIIILGSIAYFLKYNFDVDPIPTLSSIALALQKLLPAGFLIYYSYGGMKYRYEMSKQIINLVKETPQDIQLSANKKTLNPLAFEKLILKNISYSYPKTSNKIISNGNLIINKGDSIGIIGTTGSGKSTLIDLIMGFIKPQEGEILIDGLNIIDNDNQETLIKWRKSIAHVPQNIFLRSTTIIENIASGESIDKIDFEKAKKCCKACQIYDFIEGTKKGMFTTLGERGINLSGGQIQRLAIARALYREAKVLILDEATSALDTKTEKDVVNSLKAYSKKITIIAISHRISTVTNYDRLIQIKGGEIISK